MIENISESTLAGIITPGEIFVFSDSHERAYAYGNFEYLYVIKKDTEILPALEMKFFIIHTGYDWVRLLRIDKMRENCHQFVFEYKSKPIKKAGMCLLYLHRIPSFPEFLAEWKRQCEEN